MRGTSQFIPGSQTGRFVPTHKHDIAAKKKRLRRTFFFAVRGLQRQSTPLCTFPKVLDVIGVFKECIAAV